MAACIDAGNGHEGGMREPGVEMRVDMIDDFIDLTGVHFAEQVFKLLPGPDRVLGLVHSGLSDV